MKHLIKSIGLLILWLGLNLNVLAQETLETWLEEADLAFYQENNRPKALELIHKAIAAFPNSPLPYAKRLSFLSEEAEAQEKKQFLADCEQVIKLQKQNQIAQAYFLVETYEARARFYENELNFEAALADFEQLLQLAQNYQPAQETWWENYHTHLIMTHETMARIYYLNLKDNTKALESYQAALKLCQRFIEKPHQNWNLEAALNFKAMILHDQGFFKFQYLKQPQAALEDYQAAINSIKNIPSTKENTEAKNIDIANFLSAIAKVYEAEQAYEQAEQTYQQALAQIQQNGYKNLQALFLYADQGDMYLAWNKPDLACQAYKKALEQEDETLDWLVEKLQNCP